MIYIYGIIDSNVGLPESLKGLQAAPVYNIPFRGLGAAASELHAKPDPITKEHVLEHEWVVESLMKNFTILPFRFLTLFKQQDDVLTMFGSRHGDFKDNLERLRGKVEFGIKVLWPGEKIRRSLDAGKADVRVPARGETAVKIYIQEKLGKYIIAKKIEEEADRRIAAVDGIFNAFAMEKKIEKLKTENLLLSAAYLVEKEKQQDFMQAFERLSSSPGELKYLRSGPWPPYNFIRMPRQEAPLP